MNRDACGFSLSFFMHASIVGMCLYLLPTLDLQPKPLVIDFSLISGSSSQNITAPLPKQEQTLKPPPVLQAPPKPRQLALPEPVIAKKVLTRPVEKILPKKEEKVAREDSLPAAAEMSRPKEIPAAKPVVQSQVSTQESDSPLQEVVSSANASSVGVSKQEMENKYVKVHFVYIKKIIEKNISYPPIARRMGWQGKVLLSFIVCSDGRVENLHVVESSGYSQLDRNAVETVRQVEPFPGPPVRVKLVLPVTYTIT